MRRIRIVGNVRRCGSLGSRTKDERSQRNCLVGPACPTVCLRRCTRGRRSQPSESCSWPALRLGWHSIVGGLGLHGSIYIYDMWLSSSSAPHGGTRPSHGAKHAQHLSLVVLVRSLELGESWSLMRFLESGVFRV